MENDETGEGTARSDVPTSDLLEAERLEAEAWDRVQTEIPKLAKQRALIGDQIDAIHAEWADHYAMLKAARKRYSSNSGVRCHSDTGTNKD